jgi:glutaredoxin
MIEIYGKDGCPYCDKALELVKYHQLEHIYHKVGKDLVLEEFMEKFPGIKTVPVVTTYGMYIGGYDELVSYVMENSNDQRKIVRDPTQRDYYA